MKRDFQKVFDTNIPHGAWRVLCLNHRGWALDIGVVSPTETADANVRRMCQEHLTVHHPGDTIGEIK